MDCSRVLGDTQHPKGNVERQTLSSTLSVALTAKLMGSRKTRWRGLQSPTQDIQKC